MLPVTFFHCQTMTVNWNSYCTASAADPLAPLKTWNIIEFNDFRNESRAVLCRVYLLATSLLNLNEKTAAAYTATVTRTKQFSAVVSLWRKRIDNLNQLHHHLTIEHILLSFIHHFTTQLIFKMPCWTAFFENDIC